MVLLDKNKQKKFLSENGIIIFVYDFSDDNILETIQKRSKIEHISAELFFLLVYPLYFL